MKSTGAAAAAVVLTAANRHTPSWRSFSGCAPAPGHFPGISTTMGLVNVHSDTPGHARKRPKPPGLDDHLPSAQVAHLVGYLVGDFDALIKSFSACCSSFSNRRRTRTGGPSFLLAFLPRPTAPPYGQWQWCPQCRKFVLHQATSPGEAWCAGTSLLLHSSWVECGGHRWRAVECPLLLRALMWVTSAVYLVGGQVKCCFSFTPVRKGFPLARSGQRGCFAPCFLIPGPPLRPLSPQTSGRWVAREV